MKDSACLFSSGIARKGIGPESRIPSLPGKASHLERGSVGLASIGFSTSDEAVYRHLILEPLRALGLNMKDIDKYAPELHNPEIMQFAGSGDIVKKNYRMIGAMAVLSGLIEKAVMPDFLKRIGMVGFAPRQGHIPSAIPYLGHAAQAMQDGSIRRASKSRTNRSNRFAGRCGASAASDRWHRMRNVVVPTISS